MKILVEQYSANVPITIMGVQGEVDASNYRELIEVARQAYQDGSRNFLLDMTEAPFISSSGIVALHAISSLIRGSAEVDPEAGWDAIHAIDRDRGKGMQAGIKLLNLQPRVKRTIQMTGLDRYFEIFDDRDLALASYLRGE